MLDELLGRAALKEEIDALEAEIDQLEGQLKGERRRRQEAVRERQTAQERGNRLEDRIAELEGEVERLREGEREIDFRRAETVRGPRLSAVLDRLESLTGPEQGLYTAYVPENEVPEDVRDLLGERSALVRRAAPCLVCLDDAGTLAAALTTPAPPAPFERWSDGVELDRAWFEPVGEHALALVRSDLFALGVFEGDERVEYEGFESDVKGDHSKGGFSQGRFERRRDDQIDEHVERCRAELASLDVERLFVVGERTLLGDFADLATRTRAVDATGKPETALEDAVEDFWTARVYGL